MRHILVALGRPDSPGQKINLLLLFIIPIIGFLGLGYLLGHLLQVHSSIVHLIGWGLWFVWQGILFPKNRETYIERYGEQAYKKAFYRDIILGVSFGVSQMIRPLFNGLFDGFPRINPFGYLVLGSLLIVAGTSLLYTGFTIIGFDGAGFLYEYLPQKDSLIQKSIYSYIRHPLFLGGVIASIGASLFFGDINAIILAGINVVILPIYTRIEDYRLIRALGNDYARYCASVGGIIPKINWQLGLRQQK